MLTREDDIDVHALRRQGWTISAIARHLGRDRKTIRAYLSGDREAGVRARTVPDFFEVFAPYCAQRLADDPHLLARTLFDEVTDLGYDGSYPTMTRQIRTRGLRPACEPCRPATGRPIAVIDHPPGEETQWDWVELPDPPPSWGWGAHAHLLVGALSHSGAWRGVLCESEDQPHLVDGLDRIARALGGLTRDWRFDRMATVISPGTGKVSASFAGVAKHYGVVVRPCPPRRGNRKGVVEKANHVAAQRFWRTLPDNVSIEEAQARLDTWCARRADARIRSTQAGKTTVGALTAAELLRPVPAPFPATLSVERTVSAQAMVSFRGNRYSVPPDIQGRGALRRELVWCLRTGRALRAPRERSRRKTWAHVTPETLISERPAEVEDRAVPGHWEGDLLIGLERSAIGTVVERTTRFTMLVHLPREEGYRHKETPRNGPALGGYGAITMKNALATTMSTLPAQLARSLTWDRGKEMPAHAQFKVATGIPVFFADPQSPWQRGTNENTNGLLRQYFPKGTDLSRWSAEDLEAVAHALNTRPRKTLGWKTPAEAFNEHLLLLQQAGVASTG